MIKLTIDVDPDSVTIEGAVFPRPSIASRSQWIEFWNKVKELIDDEPEY